MCVTYMFMFVLFCCCCISWLLVLREVCARRGGGVGTQLQHNTTLGI